MIYRAIGLMSGSSLDGLDLVYAEFEETSGKWQYTIQAAECRPYTQEWTNALRTAHHLKALDYQLLHTAYGEYLGEMVNDFIEKHQLQYRIQLVASHGHTVFHKPSKKMTAQLGDGAAIAAVTGINVVSDLRAVDVALGGHGAPIVPIGEKMLLGDYDFFLNLGGIANISWYAGGSASGAAPLAFDICPANRVLNMLAHLLHKPFDEGGSIASTGDLESRLLNLLNDLEYYQLPYPKSLANDFGTDVVYPLIYDAGYGIPDSLRTYVEHIAFQVKQAITQLPVSGNKMRMFVTGGGAHNKFLVERLAVNLEPLNVEVLVPDHNLIDYKEALIMAFIGVLRWREENNVLSSVTGAKRDSIGGAVWIGQEW